MFEILFLLLITVTIITILIIATYKPQEKKITLSENDYNNVIKLTSEFNDYINKYNGLKLLYNVKFENKWKECIDLKDDYSMAELNKNSDAFVKYHNKALILIEETREPLQNREIEKVCNNLKMLTAAISSMNNIIEDINYIIPFKKEKEFELFDVNENVENNFFKGCNTKEEYEKRYKALLKVYHPDSGCGDSEIFIKIQNQYKEITNI